MDTQAVPAPSAKDIDQATGMEERDWREKEEKIEELTYDQERSQADQGIRHMEGDLTSLENYPLAKLAEAGVVTAQKAQELAAAGVTTLGRLVTWLGERG